MLQDGVEDVYMFLDDQEGTSDARIEREELPTAVVTLLTKCYAPGCDEDYPCYSYACPRRVGLFSLTARNGCSLRYIAKGCTYSLQSLQSCGKG